MANDQFQVQLDLEEQEKRLKEEIGDDPYTYVDPNDGTVYEWNHDKKAWFPKIDENFIAAYQSSNYSYAGAEDEKTEPAEASKASTAKQSQQQYQSLKRTVEEPAGWFEVSDEHNTNVYVSNLPLDITEEEFEEIMSKCGLIMKDPLTNKLKIKLYTDNSGKIKGDGRCCYIKVESVELALKILDGSVMRGTEISVQRAKFQLKGQYDPTKKPKKMKSKEKKKVKEQQQKLLDWRPDKLRGTRYKFERVVIIKNMFNPEEFKKQPELILEYQSDLREECGKFGQVKKVIVYDNNPEGVASVSFKEAEEADLCIQTLHGRWFGGRKLSAETWDGRSKFFVIENEEEASERLRDWEKFIEESQEEEESSQSSST